MTFNRHASALISGVVLLAASAVPVHAAVFSGSYTLDLTNFFTPPAQYGVPGDVAIDLDRFALGNSLDGVYKASIVMNYSVPVALGFGVSTSPNDPIFNTPSLILASPDPRDAFTGLVFGSVNVIGTTTTGDLLPGITTSYTFNASAGSDYYLFVAGVASSLIGPATVNYTVNVSAVPEPATVFLFAGGLVGLAALGSRRRRRN